MKPQAFPDGELMYEADIRFTGVFDFGLRMEALTTGKASIPPEGARFDQTFEGELQGPRLRGTIVGTDYLYIRPDGLFQLHLHARITTEDGANIAMRSEGVSHQIEGEREAQLRSTVSLFSSSEEYQWVNKRAHGGQPNP